MGKTKKMDESVFAKILKEFNAVGEVIRARQDEKQAIMDQFDSESKRFYFGKISERALASSVRKTNTEIQRLDDEIRKTIILAKDLGMQAKSFCAAQSPKKFTATLTGIKGSFSGGKKKVKAVKKVVKKKAKKRSSKKK